MVVSSDDDLHDAKNVSSDCTFTGCKKDVSHSFSPPCRDRKKSTNIKCVKESESEHSLKFSLLILACILKLTTNVAPFLAKHQMNSFWSGDANFYSFSLFNSRLWKRTISNMQMIFKRRLGGIRRLLD